jgi:predicted ATPase
MMTQLHFKNFKSHENTKLSLSNLNILTGSNGMGKSSVLQGLLLLRQSYFKNNLLAKGLDLNGFLCDIGVAFDAMYQYATNSLIELAFSIEPKNYQWQFAYQEPTATFLHRLNPTPELIDDISLFGNHFQYLSAARLAPQKSYIKDTYQVEVLRQISYQKGLGELVGHFLQHYAHEKIAFPNLKHPLSDSSALLEQTNTWLQEIIPQVNVIVRENPGLNAFEIRYQFTSTSANMLSTNEFKAENVGFGISYTLPIIVAILSAKPNSLIMIENPESHLHPKSQAKLAKLIALAAQNGVQIFLETHSDHIINGTLVAVKKYETEEHEGIAHDKVRIHYFQRAETQHTTCIINVPVLEGGRIKNPPYGFFDQIETDLETLMGF